ncbi:MAG TPA: amidohydrolase family protein [Acidimicrobiales bacterium]|nr:amidohydrolase family protein [Acidimicrobiales bacterium]
MSTRRNALLLRGAAVEGRNVDILVGGGLITAIGPDIDPTEADDVIDLGGRMVVAGLADAHVHFTHWAFHRLTEELNGALGSATNGDEAADAVARHAAGATAGGWIRAMGFRQSTWPAMPHKSSLDRAVPGVPVALTSQDGHSAWFSSAALAAIGMEHETGYLREWEAWEAQRLLPAYSDAQTDDAINAAVDAAVRRGITHIQDYGWSYADVAGWLRRSARGPLPLRVTSAVHMRQLDEAQEAGWRSGQILDEFGRHDVGPLKLFADGALGSRTAHCEHPYSGEPDNTGMPLLQLEELKQLLRRATSQGLNVAVHAIGDRANRTVLDAYEAVGIAGRIEHAQMIAPADRARFAALGITASIQPGHAVDDQDLVEQWWGDRVDTAYPLRTLARSGSGLVFGSDAPISPLDPWRAIAAAVHRTVDERPPWMPEETLPLADAVAASTRVTLTDGAPADLVILDEDPAHLSATDLADIPVSATMVAGTWSLRPGWS